MSPFRASPAVVHTNTLAAICELWIDFKETTNEITEKVVGFRRRNQVVSIPPVLERECEDIRKARTWYLKNTSNAEKCDTYKDKNSEESDKNPQEKTSRGKDSKYGAGFKEKQPA